MTEAGHKDWGCGMQGAGKVKQFMPCPLHPASRILLAFHVKRLHRLGGIAPSRELWVSRETGKVRGTLRIVSRGTARLASEPPKSKSFGEDRSYRKGYSLEDAPSTEEGQNVTKRQFCDTDQDEEKTDPNAKH